MKDGIRRLVMEGKASEIRALMLTSKDVKLVAYVKKRGCLRSRALARTKGISSQLANARLYRLYAAGYLNRETETAPSGGVEHVYTAAKL